MNCWLSLGLGLVGHKASLADVSSKPAPDDSKPALGLLGTRATEPSCVPRAAGTVILTVASAISPLLDMRGLFGQI